MGFKKISLKELQTKISSSFIGSPLTNIDESLEVTENFQEDQKNFISSGKGINIINEEDLEIVYDRRGNLKEFVGSGTILVRNGSKKDRIWDAQFNLLNPENTDLKDFESIKVGNLEPETNKTVNYSIQELGDLKNLAELTEQIEVVNVNLSRLPEYDNHSEEEKQIERREEKNGELEIQSSSQTINNTDEFRKSIDVKRETLKSINEHIAEIKDKIGSSKEEIAKLEEDIQDLREDKINAKEKKIDDGSEKSDKELKKQIKK